MAINFSRLTSSTNQASLEPRDIFMALPTKDKSYGYPRDVQTEVWKQWFVKRNEKNVIIKMNTGERVIIVTGCINALRSRVSGTLVNMIHALLRVIKYNYCKQCMRSKDVLALQY